MPSEPGDSGGTGFSIRQDDRTQLFRVKLRRERGRAHHVTEHHRQLAPFPRIRSSVEPLNGLLFFSSIPRFPGSGFLLWHTACPDQHFAVFIDSDTLRLDELFLERLQVLVVQLELELERTIGDPPAGSQQDYDLVQYLIKVH